MTFDQIKRYFKDAYLIGPIILIPIEKETSLCLITYKNKTEEGHQIMDYGSCFIYATFNHNTLETVYSLDYAEIFPKLFGDHLPPPTIEIEILRPKVEAICEMLKDFYTPNSIKFIEGI